MKARDRMFLTGLAVAALLVGFYLLVVAPERHTASTLGSQLSSAQSQRADALAQAQSALTAQAQYPTAYANVVRMGKAVPPSDDTPSLIYQLDNAPCLCTVDFRKISTAAASGGSTPGVALSPGGFAPLPFQFTFTGGFFQLYHYFRKVSNFTRVNGNRLDVTGRLLSIQGFSVIPTPQGSGLQADISATAYMLPPGQNLTGTATPSGPATVPTPTGAGAPTQPVSTPSSPAGAKLPTPTAVTQVGP